MEVTPDIDSDSVKCKGFLIMGSTYIINEPQHEVSNNVVYATSKASDQPVHTHSLIRAFSRHLNILSVKLLNEQQLGVSKRKMRLQRLV